MADSLFSLDNPAFAAFSFYAAIVAVKMLLMAPLTGVYRVINKAFSNPEDAALQKVKITINDDVERVRRGHLNDLENIPVFLFLGLLYVACYPSYNVALWHFRLFAGARICHTIFYLMGVQPYRGLAFMVGMVINVSMAVQVILTTISL